MIQERNGSLLDADADVICQQVNCRNTMGAGLAKAIYTRWPSVKEAYHDFCREAGDPYVLLGSVQIVKPHGAPFDVANIFGQLNYGRHSICYTNYDALRAAFFDLNRRYDLDKVIAFPHGFGCGLAGGNWDTVYALIEKSFPGRTVLIYRNEAQQ